MSGRALRVVVTGATGNCGTALLRALAGEPRVAEVRAVARRRPDVLPPKASWAGADVARDDLGPVVAGADAVVHLAWAIQPSHDEDALWRTNVLGTRRVADAAAAAGVPVLVHASSVGVYAPGPDAAAGESWPADGVRTCSYARHKAAAERHLDMVEAGHPGMRIVRARPGLVFSRPAASRVARLFAGPLMPRSLVRPGRLPLVPWVRGLRVQAVHADDLADAYRRMLLTDVRGAVNVAAAPVLDGPTVARIAGGRLWELPPAAVRAVMDVSWRMRLQPTAPGWLDMGLRTPVMSTRRAHEELGWTPSRDAACALAEILDGVSRSDGDATPPLVPGRRERPSSTVAPASGADLTESTGGVVR